MHGFLKKLTSSLFVTTFQTFKILGVTIVILSNIANISSSWGSVTPLKELSDVVPCKACLWASEAVDGLLCCFFGR